MPKVNLQSTRPSFSQGTTTKLLKEQKAVKVLVFNGKCSQVFKSTLEECVEDCILEFPAESNSIYVSKSGQVKPIPAGCNRNSITSFEEPNSSRRQSRRSNPQRNSLNQSIPLSQTGTVRNSLTNNFFLPTATLAGSTAARLRHPLVQQRFSRVESISEESSTVVGRPSVTTKIEFEEQSKRSSLLQDESISLNPNIASTSLPAFPSTRISSSHIVTGRRSIVCLIWSCSDRKNLLMCLIFHVINLNNRIENQQRN